MDPEFTTAQEKIRQRFAELPESLMEVITNGTLDAVVFDVSSEHNLTEEQEIALENEIILVLTFFAPQETFQTNIQESLGIDQRIATAISADVNENIFELVSDVFKTIERATAEAELGTRQSELSAVVAKKSELASLAATFGKKEPERLENPEVETFTSNVAPLRTMESDIKRVHGYGVAETETPEESLETKKIK